MDAEEASTIGQRLRMVRRRRGLGLAVAAGLAGISKQYLSLLERGARGFNRRGYVRFVLARCWAQAEGARDSEALRALDAADRLASVVIRHEPLARDLVLTLDRRVPRRVWELDSLRNRFGITKVNNV